MRHAFRSTPAETLIETIIAITVIIIGTAAALSMLRTSLDGNELVGQKVVAINLAVEGLDALKNIRDTNYLRFPADADTCWYTFGGTTAACGDGTSLQNGRSYFFYRDFSGTSALDWDLSRASSGTPGYLTLYTLDLGGGDSMDLYAQANVTESGFSTQETRAFTRTVTITYNDTNGDGSNDNDDASYDATVTVTWTQRGVDHSISLTRTIADVY
jgi:type II secretory pathway pseudopilin PulG